MEEDVRLKRWLIQPQQATTEKSRAEMFGAAAENFATAILDRTKVADPTKPTKNSSSGGTTCFKLVCFARRRQARTGTGLLFLTFGELAPPSPAQSDPNTPQERLHG